MSLTLDKDGNINPTLTYCPSCGGDTNELLLLGSKNFVYTSDTTGRMYVGMTQTEIFKQDRDAQGPFTKRVLKQGERLPSTSLCDTCETAHKAVHDLVVQEGGIHWRCKQCKSEGGLRGDHALSIRVREQQGDEYTMPDADTGEWKQVGVEMDECPVCDDDSKGDNA